MHESADWSDWAGAAAEVHGQVLHPRPEPAGGGVHQVPVLPPGEAGPGPRSPPVQRQHRGPHGLIHCAR